VSEITEHLIVYKKSGQGKMEFQVKKSTKFSKVANSFITAKRVDPNFIRFFFDGNRINENRMDTTLGELGLQEGDLIDCVLEQTGGFSNHKSN